MKTAGTPGGPVISRRPSDQTSPDANAYYCGVSGFKPGPTFGVGFHTFFGQGVALNVELRDMMAQLNPSGRDVNGDRSGRHQTTCRGRTPGSWAGTWSCYLPFTAHVSP